MTVYTIFDTQTEQFLPVFNTDRDRVHPPDGWDAPNPKRYQIHAVELFSLKRSIAKRAGLINDPHTQTQLKWAYRGEV